MTEEKAKAEPKSTAKPYEDLLSLVTERLSACIRAIPDKYLQMTEAELHRTAKPTGVDYALRVSFWKEFERSMSFGSSIMPARVHAGICSQTYFYSIIRKPTKIAWMIRPMQTYEREMEAILARGTERLWEIMDLPIYNAKGLPDARMAQVVLQAVKQVEDRVKGMAVQRQVSINKNQMVVGESKNVQSLEMDQVDQRIKELEQAIHGNSAPNGLTPALPAGFGENDVLDVSPDPGGAELLPVAEVPDEKSDADLPDEASA